MNLNKNQQYDFFQAKYVLMIIMMFSFGLSVNGSMAGLALLGIIILSVLIFVGSTTDDLYTYIALIPFATLVTIGSRNLLFVFLLISIIKLILKNPKAQMTYASFFMLISFFFLELSHDFFNVKIGEFAFLISFILYFLIFTVYYKFQGYSSKRAKLILISSLLIAIICTIIISGGDLVNYVNSADLTYRFGEKARSLGGAMGIPIYCLVIISLLFVQLIAERHLFIEKLFFIGIIIFSTFIGFVTISRVFLLGLVAVLLCLLLSLFLKKKSKILGSVIIVLLLGIILILQDPTFINSFISKITNRSAIDISTGRFEIYLSCYDYLKNNYFALFFGEGALNYVQIGVQNGYLFSMSAHNLYLDGLMSWGILGFGIFISFIFKYARRCKTFFQTQATVLTFMPLFVLLICNFTAGSFNDYSIYIFLLVLIIETYASGEKKKESNELA